MSDPVRQMPGERLVQRLEQRNSRRPRIGLSPAFYARFGLADPWLDTSVSADFSAVDEAFTYVSGTSWRRHMRRLALSRWWRERRQSVFNERLAGQRTLDRQEPVQLGGRGLMGMGFGPALSLSDLVFPEPIRQAAEQEEEDFGPQRSPWLSGPLHSTTSVARSGDWIRPWQPARQVRPLDSVGQRLALTTAARDPVQRAVSEATPASAARSRRNRSLVRTLVEDIGPQERTVRIRRVLRRASPAVRTIVEDALPAQGARPFEVARNRMGKGTRRGLQTAWYGRTASTRVLEQTEAGPSRPQRKARQRAPGASPTRRIQKPARVGVARSGPARTSSLRPLVLPGGDEAPAGPPEPSIQPGWRGASRAVARMVAAVDPASDGALQDERTFPALDRARRPRSPRLGNLSDASLVERLAPWSEAPDLGERASGAVWAAARDAGATPWMDRAVGSASPPSARPVGRGTRTGPARLPHWRPILGASDLVLPEVAAMAVQAEPQEAPPSPWVNHPFTPTRTVRGALSVVEQRSAMAARLTAASFVGAQVAQAATGTFQGAGAADPVAGSFTGARTARASDGGFRGAGVAGSVASAFEGARTAAASTGSFRGARSGLTGAGVFTGAAVGRGGGGTFRGAAAGTALRRAFTGAAVARQGAGGFSGAGLGEPNRRPWSSAPTARTISGTFAGAPSGTTPSGSFQGSVLRRSGPRPWSGASQTVTLAGDFTGAGVGSALPGGFAGASSVVTGAGSFEGSGLGKARAFPWSSAGVGSALTGEFAGASSVLTAAGSFAGSGLGKARAFPWSGASTAKVLERSLDVQARASRGETRRAWGVTSEGVLPTAPVDSPVAEGTEGVTPEATWSQTPYTPARTVRMVAAAAARDQSGPAVGEAAVRASERMAAVTSAVSQDSGSASPVPRWAPRSPDQTLAQPFAGAASGTTPTGEFQGAGTGEGRERAWRGAALGTAAGGRFSGAATGRTGRGTWSGASAWQTPEWDWLGAGSRVTPRGEFSGAATGAGYEPGFTGAALGAGLSREFSGARVGSAESLDFAGARAAVGMAGDFTGARSGRTPGGVFQGTRRAWTAADGTVVRSSTPPRAELRETLDGVSSEHAGQWAPGWAVRATGRTFLNTTGDLVQSLAEARDPLEIIQVILERGDRLAVSRNLPTPVVEVIRQIRATAAQEMVPPRLAAQRAADAHHSPSASVIRGRRPRSLPSTTRVVRGGGSRSPSTVGAVGGVGTGKLGQLASRLQNLIHLVQVEKRLSDAQRQVRMAAEGAEASPAEQGEAGGARAAAKSGDLEALKREVLNSVSRELELRRERGQEDNDGNWW